MVIMSNSSLSTLLPNNQRSLIIVTGLSGAGKSTAIDVLSDLGFFKVDNIPLPLLTDLVALSTKDPAKFSRLVVLPEMASAQSYQELKLLLANLEASGVIPCLLFFDARTSVIVRRYSETRRPHPGFDAKRDLTLSDAIERERQWLQSLRNKASIVVDTSEMTVHDLKRELKTLKLETTPTETRHARVNFLSFGFKHGIPIDCDLIVDVRFLPNPYFIEDLRGKSGLEEVVGNFVLSSSGAQEFISLYEKLLNFLLPRYIAEGKAYVNVGIGCTGGKHRSVAIAEALAKSFNPANYFLSVKHRDLLRPGNISGASEVSGEPQRPEPKRAP